MANNFVNVTLSVGQSKIGAGAVDRASNVVCRLAEIATPPESSARYAAIAQQVAAVVHQVGLQNVGQVGLAYPELMPPPQSLIAEPEGVTKFESSQRQGTADENQSIIGAMISSERPEPLTGEPNPIRDAIADAVKQTLGVSLPVAVLHDAAAAVLGEVSRKGTLPGCRDCLFIVWGTGVASGIVSAGSLYWRDPIIEMMTGEIGLQVIWQPDGRFEYRPSAALPALGDSELRLDRRLRGPEIARQFIRHIHQDERGLHLLALADKRADELDLVDINRAARAGDPFAVELIESAGREMGRALAPFIRYWHIDRNMAFVENIIIGSGVAKLGVGLRRGGQGILITAIRQALDQALLSLGVDDYDTSGIILSKIGYEREFYAFIPS